MNAISPVPSTNVAPTAGALLGTAGGLVVVSKLGLNPLDPATGGVLLTVIATLVTSIFHWLGKKTGIPGLG